MDRAAVYGTADRSSILCTRANFSAVAQRDRAPRSGRGGRGFDSCQHCQFRQMAERSGTRLQSGSRRFKSGSGVQVRSAYPAGDAGHVLKTCGGREAQGFDTATAPPVSEGKPATALAPPAKRLGPYAGLWVGSTAFRQLRVAAQVGSGPRCKRAQTSFNSMATHHNPVAQRTEPRSSKSLMPVRLWPGLPFSYCDFDLILLRCFHVYRICTSMALTAPATGSKSAWADVTRNPTGFQFAPAP